MTDLDPATRDLLVAIHLALGSTWHGDPDLPRRVADVRVAAGGTVRSGDDPAWAAAGLGWSIESADAARVRRADQAGIDP
jgi:hypothetical protein